MVMLINSDLVCSGTKDEHLEGRGGQLRSRNRYTVESGEKAWGLTAGGLVWQVLRFTARSGSPLPCERRSLLSLGPSSKSWLGRLSEWFTQGSSGLSVFSLVGNEVPGARGRVMGRGLVVGQGLQRQGKWCWEESPGKEVQTAPYRHPLVASVTEVRLLTPGSGTLGCQTPRPSRAEHQPSPGCTLRSLPPMGTRGGPEAISRA